MTPAAVETLLSPQAWAAALSAGAAALLWLAAGWLFYGWLASQILFEKGGQTRPAPFGPLDAGIAAALAALLIFSVAGALSSAGASTALPAKLPGDRAIVESLALSSLLTLAVVGGILASLRSRGIRWRDVFGLDRVAPGGVLGWAVVLIALALPLVQGVSLLSQVLLAASGHVDNSPQVLVQFLQARSPSASARLMVVLTAVVLAPFQEEMIFRGFLYGVARRYAGVPAGLLFNATLFALVHLHAPSFAGLFTLAVCLTLAYEWTGSIFVPMAMHAMFNSLSIVSLLHGRA